MFENQRNSFLSILIGEKLSSVTFVMDYLQLNFDGNRFTLNIWPVVTINNNEYRIEDPFYRDSLCSLITRIVAQANVEENQNLIITFESGNNLTLSLDPNNEAIITPEIATFSDTKGNFVVFN